MSQIAGRVVLEEGFADQKFSLQSMEHLCIRLGACMGREESRFGLQDCRIRGKAAARGNRAKEPVRCRAPGMQRLRPSAKTRFEAGSLRSRQSQRVQPPVLPKVEHPGACSRRAEGSEGARRMKSDHIVLRANQRTKPAFGF